MTISSRTPEGFPGKCLLCGADTRLEFSDPGDDAPCPNCGCLVFQSLELFDRLAARLSQQIGVAENSIGVETLLADLQNDSLDVVEMVMEFEDEFDEPVPDDDYASIKTVGDLIRYMQKRSSN